MLLLLMPPFFMKNGARVVDATLLYEERSARAFRADEWPPRPVCKPGHPARWALTRVMPARPYVPLRVPSRPQQREHVVSQELVVVAEKDWEGLHQQRHAGSRGRDLSATKEGQPTPPPPAPPPLPHPKCRPHAGRASGVEFLASSQTPRGRGCAALLVFSRRRSAR